MEVLIDTNFILTCIKRKLDFISLSEQLFSEKIDFIIPEEVLDELKKLSKRKGEKTEDKSAAETAIKFAKEAKLKTFSLKSKNVDDGIVDYAKKNNVIIATMDRALKQRVKGNILTVIDDKSLEIV